MSKLKISDPVISYEGIPHMEYWQGYFMARSRLWKRVAKKWRSLWKVEQQEGIVDNKLRLQAAALAASRLGLLRRWNKKRVKKQERCLFCGEYPIPVYGEIQLYGKKEWRPITGYKDSHADYCELAKALVSEQSEEELE